MALWRALSERRRFRLALRAGCLLFGLVAGFVTSILVQERLYMWSILPTAVLIFAALAEFVLADILADRIYPARTQAILDNLEENLRQYDERIRGAIDRSIQSLTACNRRAVSGTFHLRVDLYSSFGDDSEEALVQVIDYSGRLGGRKWRFNPSTKGLIGRCLRTQAPECVNFATESEYCERMISEFGYSSAEVEKHTREARSYWAQPVFVARTCVGVMFLFSTEQQVFPRAADIANMESVAHEISAYLEGARIVSVEPIGLKVE